MKDLKGLLRITEAHIKSGSELRGNPGGIYQCPKKEETLCWPEKFRKTVGKTVEKLEPSCFAGGDVRQRVC